VDLDGAAAKEKLGFDFGALLAQFNILLSRDEFGGSSTTRSFATREATLREELVHSRNCSTPSAKRFLRWRREFCPCGSGL